MLDSNPTETEKNIEIGDSNSTREKKSRKDKSKSLSTKVVIRRLVKSKRNNNQNLSFTDPSVFCSRHQWMKKRF